MIEMVEAELTAHKETIEKVIAQLRPDIKMACRLCVETVKHGKKILFFGNDESAVDAQHLAAKLSGRYKRERKTFPVALTTVSSVITAIGNDYEYDYIFERQIEAIAKPGDLLVGISSTGNCDNIIRAFEKGESIGCNTLLFGCTLDGNMYGKCDLSIIVPSDITHRVQEMHTLIGHILCQAIDDAFSKDI